MKKLILYVVSAMLAGTAFCAVTTHLSLDCGGAKVVNSTHPLVYDAAWYEGGVTAKITANGDEIVSGMAGTYAWTPSFDGVNLLTLNVYNALDEVVGTESVFCLSREDLTELVIPEGTTEIGAFAFAGGRFTSVTIPNSVTSIGAYAFICCDGLTSVTIPSSVTSIEEGAFADCWGLTSVIIPLNVTSIGDYAFFECWGLTSVTIPPSVTSISQAAFYGCYGLTSVTIPSSVTSIGDFAFVGCSSLKTIYAGRTGVKRMLRESGFDVDSVIFDCVSLDTNIVGEKVMIDTGLKDYTVSGLPSGLKYSKTTGLITGAATKPTATEGVVVKFTKSGAETEKLTIVVRAEEISAGCKGLSSGPLPAGVVGAADGMDIEIDSEGGTKSVSVTKLPSGMKYDKKSGKITGAPTKAGDYEIVVTVTTAYGNKESFKIPVSVEAMPVVAVGKFNGFVSVGEDYLGAFSLTTTDAGKLTAKVVTAAGTVSFSGTCWDAVVNGVYRATLTTKKGERLALTLDTTADWDANQLTGSFTTAAVAATKKTAAVPSRTYAVSAQRNAFGKTWYFAATGDEQRGWTLSAAESAKVAALTVTLKADGTTALAGKLPGLPDAKGKSVTFKVSASGAVNLGGIREGALMADFAPVLTINKVKKVLSITTNLWLDRTTDHTGNFGRAKIAE